MYLNKGDLIQFNIFHDFSEAYDEEWVLGLVLGVHPGNEYAMRVFWFDDYQETEEPSPQNGREYRMFSPGSSVG